MRVRAGLILRAMTVLLLALLAPAVAQAGDKPALNGVALVIGQSKYQHVAPLPNPANDARDMLGLLSDLGFDARSASDRDSKKLKRDLERFVEDAEGADVAFLYYSGHGIEAAGENWLVPVDADVSSLDDAEETLVALSSVMDELKAKVPVAIVLLDACRTNPFPAGAVLRKHKDDQGSPVGDGGLTVVRGAASLAGGKPATENLGTVIGFAAEPGRPALDGTAGGNSPYAAALMRHLGAMGGEEFGAVMRMVTEEVYLDTKAQQRPWTNESLRRFLYFGVPEEEPQGDDGLITRERRKLLLTISDMPAASRAEVQNVAARSDVPMDSLFGVLRALGTDIPADPADLDKVLDAQAARLKQMIAEREALRSDDPEIRRLSDAADTAIRQGAIDTARQFLDKAVKRVEQTASAVDQAEEKVKEKRLADAAVYAQRAAASALVFDYAAAAADYGKAWELAEKWDEKLRWNYKNQEAEALLAAGQAAGDAALLRKSIDAYQTILNLIPRDQENRDWAITRNNMAVVYQAIGESEAKNDNLEKAIEIFRASQAVFEREKDDANWTAAETNIGNALLTLGQRESDPKRLEAAVESFKLALAKRDRATAPLEWAGAENNVAIALYTLGNRTGDTGRMEEAEKAYRMALEEYTREKSPLNWAMVQNNLGNALSGLAAARNDRALYEAAADAYRASIEVRTRETFPLLYGRTQANLAGTLHNLGKLDRDVVRLRAAVAAIDEALTVLTREKTPLDWANALNTKASSLQVLAQTEMNADEAAKSVEAARGALEVYTRQALPLDWAMLQNTLGNSYRLLGGLTDDQAAVGKGVEAFRSALEVFDKAKTPMQWAIVQTSLGSSLETLARFEKPVENMKASIAARRAALEVLTEENAPIEWATAQNGIGSNLLLINYQEKSRKNLIDAKEAFEAAARVFTKDAAPLQWALTVNNLGDLHVALATDGGGAADFDEAVRNFEAAKEAYQQSGFLPPVALLDQKIELVKKMRGK